MKPLSFVFLTVACLFVFAPSAASGSGNEEGRIAFGIGDLLQPGPASSHLTASRSGYHQAPQLRS
jgi:hypothetical protein